jgi:predicted nucleotidyltransferase
MNSKVIAETIYTVLRDSTERYKYPGSQSSYTEMSNSHVDHIRREFLYLPENIRESLRNENVLDEVFEFLNEMYDSRAIAVILYDQPDRIVEKYVSGLLLMAGSLMKDHAIFAYGVFYKFSLDFLRKSSEEIPSEDREEYVDGFLKYISSIRDS